MKVFQGKGKILGIVGGMGTAASNLFCDLLYENTEADLDQDNIDFLLLNHASMIDRTEAIKQGRSQELLDLILYDVGFLEKAGVCAIAIPCNTSHFLYDQIAASTSVEVLNIVKETEKHIIGEKLAGPGDKIGLLATDGTIEMGIYQKYLSEAGFEAVVPEARIQKKIMAIIYDGVKKGKKVEASQLKEIEEFFRNKGCRRLILGCTELSVVDRENGGLGEYYVDSMVCLAKAAVDRCKK